MWWLRSPKSLSYHFLISGMQLWVKRPFEDESHKDCHAARVCSWIFPKVRSCSESSSGSIVKLMRFLNNTKPRNLFRSGIEFKSGARAHV